MPTNQVDVDAWQRAIAMARAEGPDRAEQIDAMLADDSFEDVGKFAAYSCQMDTLRLRPWESPPCHAGDGDTQALKLAAKLEAAGLSRWEPDPPTALAGK